MPSPTLDDVLKRSAELLQDQQFERFSRQRLLDALNLGLTEMRRVRPEIPALRDDSSLGRYTLEDVVRGEPIPLHPQYYGSLVAFVTGWIEAANDESAVGQRSSAFLQRFTQQMVAGG